LRKLFFQNGIYRGQCNSTGRNGKKVYKMLNISFIKYINIARNYLDVILNV